jgi:hypothetical protein
LTVAVSAVVDVEPLDDVVDELFDEPPPHPASAAITSRLALQSVTFCMMPPVSADVVGGALQAA